MTETASSPRLEEILFRLENGARSQPEQTKPENSQRFETIRAEYYDAYDAAKLEGVAHDEARILASRHELDFRRLQGREMQRWLRERADLVTEATQNIATPHMRTCLDGLFPMLVDRLPNGLPRYRHDVAQALLTTLGVEMSSGTAHGTVCDLYQAARKACNRVADGSFFSEPELAGKTTAQAHQMDVPMYVAPSDRVIKKVEQAGFRPRLMINHGLQTLGEPILFASITTE